MYDPEHIPSWLEEKVEGMRRSLDIPFHSITLEKGDGTGAHDGLMLRPINCGISSPISMPKRQESSSISINGPSSNTYRDFRAT